VLIEDIIVAGHYLIGVLLGQPLEGHIR